MSRIPDGACRYQVLITRVALICRYLFHRTSAVAYPRHRFRGKIASSSTLLLVFSSTSWTILVSASAIFSG